MGKSLLDVAAAPGASMAGQWPAAAHGVDTETEDRDAAELFETAFSEAPTGVAVIGLDGRFVRVNSALCDMLGRSEDDLIGSTSARFTHPDDLQTTADAFTRMRDIGHSLTVEKRYLRPDGQVVWAATVGIGVKGRDGEVTRFVSHFSDISAVKLAQRRQAEATALFETAFADAPIGMGLVALDGRWLKVNRVLCELTGHSEEQLLRLTFQELTHPDDLDADLELVRQVLAGAIDGYRIEKRYFNAAGEVIWINLAASLVRDSDGEPLHFIAQIEDISERRKLHAELRRLADDDPLTGLWNRRRFREELERQVHRCQRYEEQAALLLLDLDGFKSVNDTYGHQAGDDLLKQIADSLRKRLRSTDAVGRLGGDEFAVLLTHVTPEQADQLANTLAELIAASVIHHSDTQIGVTASIGVELLDAAATTHHDAIKHADAAMYRAKARSATPSRP
jgi:diguanylate cyclase (GGDEF)-like protein/PAS domain S-box-containing protein